MKRMCTDIIPPKHIQQLYFQKEKLDSNASYSIGFDLVIKGEVKRKVIKSSLFQNVKNTSSFNYKFSLEKDGLHQKRLPENNHFSYNAFDCSNETLEVLKIRILNEAPLDIYPEKGQNIAARLYKLSATVHILSVTASHLMADAQSMEILLKDFLDEFKIRCRDENQAEELFTSLLPGPLSVQQAYEATKTINQSNIQNLKSLCYQEDVSLFSLLMAGLITVPDLKTDTIGVLFSNRTPENQSDVGCFVQAVPVYLYERRSVLEMAKGVRQQVTKIQSSLKNNEPLPAPPQFEVMFSMVKNTDTALHGPDGVSVEYLRRLHTKPECGLHIYAYQYQEKLEIVFNYDPDHWDHNDLESMLSQYVENLITLSDQKNWKSEPFNNVGSQMPEVRFDHVGVATWEMDIGLMRLQANGKLDSVQKRVKDSSMDVELASFDAGILRQIELVTPLSKKAPCVGFLERLGEGPYHCSWQVTSIQQVLNNLEHFNIKYTLIKKYDESKLFSKTPIHFFEISGVGLVEFVEKDDIQTQTIETGSLTPENKIIPLTIDVISDDLENAVKFLHMLGYVPQNPTQGIWQNENGMILLQIINNYGENESRIYRVSTSNFSEIEEGSTSIQKTLSDSWRRRVCL